MRRIALAVAAAAILALALSARAAPAPHLVRPSQADASIHDFDEPSVAIPGPRPGAPLAIFLAGTKGRPQNAMALLNAISGQGYAVIGLEYPDEPAVVQECARNPDPACSADFRRMRLHGDGPYKAITNTAAESIAGRLSALLRALDRDHPGEGWGVYLKDGAPDWSRMVLSGQSQGAGMAAYLAKETPVARVVLFSSPWDFTQPGRALAPWISAPSATPPERWYGAYNRREQTADLLARSYRALGIPADHVRVLGLDLPPGARPNGPNPYHGQGIHDPRYAPEWRFLYGEAR